MTFSELSSKLGGIEGRNNNYDDNQDMMKIKRSSHMELGTMTNLPFNDFNSSAHISVATPVDSLQDVSKKDISCDFQNLPALM